jgi:RNA polymerase sigma-70 factor (ECF subfamily)
VCLSIPTPGARFPDASRDFAWAPRTPEYKRTIRIDTEKERNAFQKEESLAGKMNPTEAEMVQRARRGDEEAFKEIIRLHEGQVAATVIGILGSGPEVDDLGQETFIQLYLSLDRFRGDSQLRTYLTRIAINLSLNELKRRKRQVRLFEPGPPDSRNGLRCQKKQETAADAKGIVQSGLDRLPAEFRAVIVLRLINGYSTRETADILRLPQGTVLSRLARGQAKLKEIIDGMNGHKP